VSVSISLRSTLGRRHFFFREFGSRIADDYLVIHSAFRTRIREPDAGGGECVRITACLAVTAAADGPIVISGLNVQVRNLGNPERS
jgi:hypothetical protein